MKNIVLSFISLSALIFLFDFDSKKISINYKNCMKKEYEISKNVDKAAVVCRHLK